MNPPQCTNGAVLTACSCSQTPLDPTMTQYDYSCTLTYDGGKAAKTVTGTDFDGELSAVAPPSVRTLARRSGVAGSKDAALLME